MPVIVVTARSYCHAMDLPHNESDSEPMGGSPTSDLTQAPAGGPASTNSVVGNPSLDNVVAPISGRARRARMALSVVILVGGLLVFFIGLIAAALPHASAAAAVGLLVLGGLTTVVGLGLIANVRRPPSSPSTTLSP